MSKSKTAPSNNPKHNPLPQPSPGKFNVHVGETKANVPVMQNPPPTPTKKSS